jgi:hypothetical protein
LYYLRQRTGKATRIKEKLGGKKVVAQVQAASPAPASATEPVQS